MGLRTGYRTLFASLVSPIPESWIMAARHIGPWRTAAQGHLTVDDNGDAQTDYARWRLLDDRGRQTWRYLESDEENDNWPQSVAEKYFLGLPMVFSITHN